MRDGLLGPAGHVESLKSLYRSQAENSLAIHKKQLKEEQDTLEADTKELARLRNLPKATEAGYQERVLARVTDIQSDPTGAAGKYNLGAEYNAVVDRQTSMKAEVAAMLPILKSALNSEVGEGWWGESANTITKRKSNEKFQAILTDALREGAGSGMSVEDLDWYTEQAGGNPGQTVPNITNRMMEKLNALLPEIGAGDLGRFGLTGEEGTITAADLMGPRGADIIAMIANATSDELRKKVDSMDTAGGEWDDFKGTKGINALAQGSLDSDLSIETKIQALTLESDSRTALIEGMVEGTEALSSAVDTLAAADDKLETVIEDLDKKTPGAKNPLLTPTAPTEEAAEWDGEKVKENVGKFSSGAAFILSASGRQEEAAKVMKAASMIMMPIAIMERAREAMAQMKEGVDF